MKIVVSRPGLLITSVIASFILAFLLLWHFTPQIITAYKLYWLFPIMTIFFLITPYGSRRLQSDSNQSPRYKVVPWLLQIMAVELSLLAVFWGICTIIGKVLPVLTTAHPHLFTTTINFLSINTGGFPWAGIALLAVSIGYISYHSNQDAYLSSTLNPILKSSTTQTMGIISNFAVRISTLLAISSSIAFISLLMTSLFVPQHTMLSFSGFKPLALIVMFLLLLLVINRRFTQKITAILNKKQFTPAKLILLFTLCLTIVLTLLMLFFGGSSIAMSTHQGMIKTPFIIQSLLKNGWLTLWKIFAILWWLSWLPLMGVYIAKLSKGYSVRAIILAVITLPLILSVILFFTQPTTVHAVNSHLLEAWATRIIPIIGFLVLIALVVKEKQFPALMLTFLPKQGKIKYRKYNLYLSKLLQFSTAVIYIYLPSDITLLTLIMFVGILILSALVLLVPFALFKILK